MIHESSESIHRKYSAVISCIVMFHTKKNGEKKMAHQKVLFKQNLESDSISIEFLDEKVVSPVEAKPKQEKYVLSAPLSKKHLRSDRKMRKNTYVKFNRPANVFAPAERRISY